MLLERVGCFFFRVNFKNLILLYLWVFLCLKVGDNDVSVLSSDATTRWYRYPAHFESVLNLPDYLTSGIVPLGWFW